MELEEMKTIWTEMSVQIEKQKDLTDKLIIDMTRQKYKSILNNIRIPELIGSLVSLGFVVLILINFNKYQTAYLISCSIISLIILILMPVLSIRAINRVNDLDIKKSNLKQILIDYAREKQKFLMVQKLSFYLGFVLLITTLPVMLTIMGGKNTEVKSEVWFWFLSLGSLLFILFARWVYGYYVRNTIRVENLLKELEE
jgi:hypothetical protein